MMTDRAPAPAPRRRARIRRSLQASASAILAAASILGPARDARAEEAFPLSEVVHGSTATEESCRALPAAAWVVVDGRGDCIRYFPSGAQRSNPVAAVFLHGDRLLQLWNDREFTTLRELRVVGYAGASPARVQEEVARNAAAAQRPFIFLGRPGVYGSSGDHKERRRPREVALVDAALDAIKARYDVERFVLAGHSGGGHLVGALLSRRADVGCAVIAAGVVAVEARIQALGWPKDATGYADYVDPIKEVGRIPRGDALRVFVIGDPRDGVVPFSTARAYVEALRRHGVAAHLAEARGAGPDHHGLARSAQTVAGWCAIGLPTEEILARLRQGLSG
jgi:dienelactone hydrolase